MKQLSLVLSIVALGLASFALYKAPGPLLSRGTGMAAYDLSTPESAFRASQEMQAKQDINAMIEVGKLVNAERHRTMQVEDSAIHEDRVVLFISFEEDGKRVYKTQGMKQLHDGDIWIQDYVSRYDLRSKNAKLAKRMEEWEQRGKDDKGK